MWWPNALWPVPPAGGAQVAHHSARHPEADASVELWWIMGPTVGPLRGPPDDPKDPAP